MKYAHNKFRKRLEKINTVCYTVIVRNAYQQTERGINYDVF